MLSPIFQVPSFNIEWMASNKRISEDVARGAPSLGIIPPGANLSTTDTGQVVPPSQGGISNPVAAGTESSQTRSSTEKSDSSKESEQREESAALTTEENREVTRLQTTERNVRAHEKAHLNAAQGIALSGADYEYQVGPDDRRYAVAGEVDIDTSRESEPAKTIDKGYKIIRAALAPSDPSPQDLSVASGAEQMILDAQAELIRTTYASNQKLKQAEAEGSQNGGSTIDQRV